MKLFVDENRYIDTREALDISLPLSDTDQNPLAWYLDRPVFEPVISDAFVGSVNLGGSVNFRTIRFNPHGHGTHTECLGHITQEIHSVNRTMTEFFFSCRVLSVHPEVFFNERFGEEDQVIRPEAFAALEGFRFDALVIRTMPNEPEKRSAHYSATNPPYLDVRCFEVFERAGIRHLLIDMPSVDRENDNGELAGHHAFWNVPQRPAFDKTITELIYVEPAILDGDYILELQVAAFENDAAPSRPVLYKIYE